MNEVAAVAGAQTLMSSPWSPSIRSLFGAVACSTPPTRMSVRLVALEQVVALQADQQIAGRAAAQDVGVVEVLLRRHARRLDERVGRVVVVPADQHVASAVAELKRGSGGAGGHRGDDEEEENESAVSAE